jgi:regulator of RNase E activity RraB
MITAKEAKRKTEITRAIKQCEKAFEERIQLSISQECYQIKVSVAEMPPLGVDAFKQLGYEVEPIDECRNEDGRIVAYFIKWGDPVLIK